MSNVKLKRSDLHPLRVWGWSCPKCEYWNETDRDPDSCLTEQYDCDGCFHEFEWNTETKEKDDD